VTTVIAVPTETLSELYEKDETAWLDAMAELASFGSADKLDLQNLCEYLSDMAISHRRELWSRMVVLLAHLLKWDLQPDRRSGSWRVTIRHQRNELRMLCQSGSLSNHALSILVECFDQARIYAADETGLPLETFPAVCPMTLAELLAESELSA